MQEEQLYTAFELMDSELKGAPDGNKVGKCPLAQWLHRAGVDKSPSLTAKVRDDVAVFKCWACQSQGTVKKLVRLYADYSGDFRAYEYVNAVLGDAPVSNWRPMKMKYGDNFKKTGKKLMDKRVINEDTLPSMLEEIPNYAFERGMTNEQVIRWEIGYDKIEKRMIFPVRDFQGKLMGVSGRDLTGLVDNKYKHYFGMKKEMVLYGERFVSHLIKKPIYIVEGFFDVFGLERRGITNTVATMGTSISLEQARRMKMWTDRAIFLPDGDMPGLKFALGTAEQLFLKYGIKGVVLGVKPNNGYIQRDKPNNKWIDSDYVGEFIPGFKNIDPSDWTDVQIKEAHANACFFEKMGKNGVEPRWGQL